jgi:hypothetical protein
MASLVPVPDPGGALEPPRRNPPTALAAPAYEPEPSPFRRPGARKPASVLRKLALALLDAADTTARIMKRTVRPLS